MCFVILTTMNTSIDWRLFNVYLFFCLIFLHNRVPLHIDSFNYSTLCKMIFLIYEFNRDLKVETGTYVLTYRVGKRLRKTISQP